MLGEKLDLARFLQYGFYQNPITKKYQFDIQVLDNLDKEYFKYLAFCKKQHYAVNSVQQNNEIFTIK